MSQILKIATFATILAASLPAQRLHGGGSLAYQAIPGAGSSNMVTLLGNTLSWYHSGPPSATANAVMPMVVAGGVLNAGGGEFIASGWDGSAGILVRLSLHMESGSPQVTILETLPTGTFDPESIEYSPLESGLIALDRAQSSFLFVSWTPGGTFGATEPIGSLPADIKRPVSLRAAFAPHETPGAVYADSWSALRRVGVTWRYRPYRIGASWFIESTDMSPITTPTSTGWAVRHYERQSNEGVLGVRAVGGGAFSVIRVGDRMPVMGGTIPAADAWHDMPIPSGSFEPGQAYKVVGAGQPDGKVFWPSFRLGQPNTDTTPLSLDYGKLDPAAMRDGNLAFAVSGRLLWASPETQSQKAIPYYLWAKIGTPGAGTVATLPGGEVVISDPDVTFVGRRPSIIFGSPGYRPIRQKVDLGSGFAGTSILFQWLAITDDDQVIISDVFGSTIRPPGASLSSNSQSSPATQQSSASSLTTGANAAALLRGQRTAAGQDAYQSLRHKLGISH